MRNAFRRVAGLLRLAPAFAAVLFVACGDSKPTEVNPSDLDATPSLLISDGRNGGNEEFYFLPPIAPSLTTYPGTFDGNRSPVIEICRYTGTACSGGLTTFSRGAGTIVLDAAAQVYRANWTVSGLPTGQLYRIRVLEGTTVLGVADAKKPGAGETPQGLTAAGIVPLGNASTLAIRFRMQDVPTVPGNDPPVVTITAPANNTVVAAGNSVTISATATDPQQGNLTSQIVYRSNRVVNPLGTGASVTTTLPVGRNTISASVTDAGGLTGTSTIDVIISIITLPATLNVPYGGTASLPITLTEPAPAGGLTLTVTTSNASRVGLAASSVIIPAGQQSANVTVQGNGPGPSTVTVSNPDFGSASSQVTTTANLNIVQSNLAFPQGRSEQITIELESQGADAAAPAGGLVVALTSAAPGCATATSPVTIPAGLVSITATVTYGGSATVPCNTTITANASGITGVTPDNVSVQIQASPLLTITLFGGDRIGRGLRQTSLTRVNLGVVAPTGGVVVTLASADGAVARVAPTQPASTVASASATVTVPAGNSTADFFIDGVEGASGAVTLTASATGYANATAAVNIVGVAVRFNSAPPANTTTLSPNNPITAIIGALDASGTQAAATQAVRPGGTPITVTFTNSDAAVGRLVNTAGTAQTRTATIGVGEVATPSGAAAGGVEFDPLGAGSTTVSVSGTGLTAVPTSSQIVTVSGPGLTISLFGGDRIGRGLRQASVTRVNLGAPAPTGGLVVTLASSDGAVGRVAPTQPAGTVASASATVTVPAGNSNADFFIDGVEGASGAVTLTASAPGFTGATTSVTITGVSVRFNSAPPANTTTGSANTGITAVIGALDASGTNTAATQAVRPGGTPITVTFTNSNASVAQLVNTAGAAQTRTATIGVGEVVTPFGAAAGGVEFDPLGGGTTTVSVSGTGLTPVPTSSQVVTVAAPTLTISLFGGDRIGRGLRQGSVTRVNLAAPAPAGGLVVTLASSNGSVARVAPTVPAATVSSASATVTVAAGNSNADFFIDGVEGASGAVTLTASAPGFGSTTASVTITGVSLRFNSAPPANTTTLSPNTSITAVIGALDASGTQAAANQAVRPGGTPITVTFTNSNSGVGQLVNTAGAGQTRTATIDVGQQITPFGAAAGGVEFDPLGAGSTTVSVSGTGLTPVPTSSQTVTVAAPALTISLFGGDRIGRGLRQASLTRVNLGAPAPTGGVAVTIASSNGSVARVAPTSPAGTVSSASVTITVPAGSFNADVYVDGMEGASGTVTLTASAPGYTNGTASVTITGVSVRFNSAPPANTTTGSANTSITAIIGALDASGTNTAGNQAVRPGGTPITVTFTNSNASVARLVNTAGTGQTRTATIGVGEQLTPFGAAVGGVEFDPLGEGTTTVSVSGTGLTPVPTSSQNVTVTAAAALRAATRVPARAPVVPNR